MGKVKRDESWNKLARIAELVASLYTSKSSKLHYGFLQEHGNSFFVIIPENLSVKKDDSIFLLSLADPINNLRSHLHAFGTNIESFFHNILVDEKDKAIFRFCWFKNPEMTELELYQFLAHIFGASSSLTVTGWVLRHEPRSREPKGRDKQRSV